MKYAWILTGVDGQVQRLSVRSAGATTGTVVHPVLTVRDVCRRLGKSRRQLYRYLRTGRLRPCARVLGQWLFSPAEVEAAAHGAVPGTLRRLFWDVRLSSLSVVRHQEFILARILEFGDSDALRWLFKTYPREQMVSFLEGRGAERLSRRAWTFWMAHVGRRPRTRRRRSWRFRGRAWGGVG